MPAITPQPDPPAWDVDADWWGPNWDVVKPVGPAEPVAGPGSPRAAAPDQAVPVPAVSHATDAEPSWRQVLATTISLWAQRHRPSAGATRVQTRAHARLLSAAVLGAGLLAAGVGTVGLIVTYASSAPTVRLPARPSPVTVPSGRTLVPLSLSAVAPAPKPVWLTIPALGVKAPIVTLGLNRNGTLQVPSSTKVVGWYTNSPRPGTTGTAVIAGHVDSRSGPGVFFWLHTMHAGERIYVRRADGTLAVFTVTAVRTYTKARFPTAMVYGPVPDAELRLITCGGTFDYARGTYLSNVVVYARLSG